MTRPTLLAGWFLAAATGLAARAPQDVPLKDVLGPEDVKQVGARLRDLQRSADPKLLEAIDKLLKANPGLQLDQLAQKLLEQRPDLRREENLPKLSKAIEQAAPKLGPPASPSPGGSTTNPGTAANPPNTGPPKDAPPRDTVTPSNPGVAPKAETPPGSHESPAPGAAQPPAAKGAAPNPRPELDPKKPPEAGEQVPPPPPKLAANPANPPPGKARVGDEVPPPTPKANAPPVSEQQQRFAAAAGWWEKNVGPIEDSPAVREMLLEFIKGAGSADGQSPLSKLLKDFKGDGPGGMKDWAKDALPKDFRLPDLGLKGTFGGLPSAPTLPPAPAAPPSFDFGGLGGSWAPVYLVALIALAAFAYFAAWPWWRGRADGATPTPVPGLGPWPLDPRSITSREGLVRAFDYLSVLTLGDEARQYNHVTIAGELRRRVPAADDIADELGGYYALARYTPPADPLTPAEVAAARAALCRLAGVPA